MNSELMWSSKTDEWATPWDFFLGLDQEFHFTLDPCANKHNHKCEKYYTFEDDGLQQSWKGERVFCNPPYGRAIGNWVRKAFFEAYTGGAELCVLLLPARTDTRWFHDYIYNKAEIRFIRGRLKFGGQRNGAPFPNMVVVYRGAKVGNYEPTLSAKNAKCE